MDQEREVQNPLDCERGDYIAKYLLLQVHSIPQSPSCKRECFIFKGWGRGHLGNPDVWELLQLGWAGDCMYGGGACDIQNTSCIYCCSRQMSLGSGLNSPVMALSCYKRIFTVQPGICPGVHYCQSCGYSGLRLPQPIWVCLMLSKLRGKAAFVLTSIPPLHNVDVHVSIRTEFTITCRFWTRCINTCKLCSMGICMYNLHKHIYDDPCFPDVLQIHVWWLSNLLSAPNGTN